jgi:hypothetical protein
MANPSDRRKCQIELGWALAAPTTIRLRGSQTMTTTTTIEKLLKGVGLNSSLLKHLSLLGSTVPTVPSSFGVGHLAQVGSSPLAISPVKLRTPS